MGSPARPPLAAESAVQRTEERRRHRLPQSLPGLWLLSVRDLQWRRRRVAIAVGGTSLAFAMTLVLSGLAASFVAEATRTVDGLGADAWVVRDGVPGPFTSISTMPDQAWRAVLASPTVQAADPLIVLHQTSLRPRTKDLNLFGYRKGGVGEPPVVEGRGASRTGEAVVDETMGLSLGERFELSGRRFRVVGLTRGMTYNAGAPNVYVSIKDAQALAFEGRPIANVVLSRGTPLSVPKGLKVITNEQARNDILRPLANASSAINQVRLLLWIVAVNIIGSVVYLSALERVRDFAVLKATGYSSRSLLASLSVQAVVIALAATAVGTGLAYILVPVFPLPAVVPAGAQIALPGIAVAVGLLASLFGARRVNAVDPALAFGGP